MDTIIAGVIIVVVAAVIYFVVKKTKYLPIGDKLRQIIGKFKKDE